MGATVTDVADFRAYHWARAGVGSPIEEAAIDRVVSWRELEDRYEDDLACQGPNHPRQKYGHRLPAPAEYEVTHGCGHRFNMCAPWVHALAGYAQVQCGECGHLQVANTLGIREL
jgi:hypothetical protein